jgi:hypothetical protein
MGGRSIPHPLEGHTYVARKACMMLALGATMSSSSDVAWMALVGGGVPHEMDGGEHPTGMCAAGPCCAVLGRGEVSRQLSAGHLSLHPVHFPPHHGPCPSPIRQFMSLRETEISKPQALNCWRG